MKRIAAALLLLGLVLAFPAAARAEGDAAEENLLRNAYFADYLEGAALPAEWEFEAYVSGDDAAKAGLYEDETAGRCVGIVNGTENDSRICQTIAARPDTCYLVSGYIRTSSVTGGRGACLSIDNYSIDGTYCFSTDVTGSSEWTAVEMYVKTGPEQRELRVAARLGGYGTMAVGSAWFYGLRVTECDESLATNLIYLPTDNGAAGTATETPKAPLPPPRVFSAMLVTGMVFALLFAALYMAYLRSEQSPLSDDADTKRTLTAMFALAVACRVLLSVIFVGHPTDINCFMAWGNAVRSNGVAAFYTSGIFADYPPGYMYVCGALSALGSGLGLTYGSAGHVLLFKLPATICDLISAYLLYELARRNGVSRPFSLLLAGLVALNPALMFISGGWGQIDSILALLVALAIYFVLGEKRILAGALYGLAILLKPQALMAGPILAAIYFRGVVGPDWKKKLLHTALAVLAALAVIFFISLPFKGTQDWTWILDKYRTTAVSYPYASIEAFNMPALLGGNWASVETRVLGLPYSTWGTAFIALSVLFSGALYWKGACTGKGAAYISCALSIALMFTFGHYMHERYVIPALLLLLVGYAYYRDRRLLLVFLSYTVTVLLNSLAALYIVDHQAARGVFYNVLTRVGSAATVLTTLYFLVVAVDLLWLSRALAPLPALQVKQKRKRETFALPVSGDGGTRYTRKDTILLLSLVLVYGAAALTYLGVTKAPQTVYYGDVAGETVTAAFGRTVELAECRVYGNIDTGGVLRFTAPDGAETSYEQTYDDMFRWHSVLLAATADTVTVELCSGHVRINEIAFFDAAGNRLPATLVNPTGTQSALLDEQDTVPDVPACTNGMYLDELYHGRTAYEHLHNLAPYENSHPPLGKLFIMLGVAAFGMTPFGWRIVGTLFGIGMLPVFYALSRRLLKKTENAFVCTALFAFDFMHFTQTRIATIDVYAVFFILLMYYFMYRYVTMDFFADGLKKTLVPLGACGLFFGIGAACKWTCIYAGAGLAALLFFSLFERYRKYRALSASASHADRAKAALFLPNTIKTLLFCVAFFVVIPFAIYFAAYAPYYIYAAGTEENYGLSGMFRTFWHYQEFMYNYHSTLQATHPYQSSWYQWPFTVRPMWYYYSGTEDTVSTMSVSGNPAVWWISSIGAFALAALRLSGKVRPDKALLVIFTGILANYLPWVLVSRCTFIYHFFATVPFILLATMYLVTALEEREPELWPVKWVWLALGLLFFIVLYPGISGLPIPRTLAETLQKLPGGNILYGA